MNERIKELEKEAIACLKHKPFSTAQFHEKFAEIIVRQCMNLVKDCYAEPGRSLYQSVCASTIIEEHFGIEE